MVYRKLLQLIFVSLMVFTSYSMIDRKEASRKIRKMPLMNLGKPEQPLSVFHDKLQQGKRGKKKLVCVQPSAIQQKMVACNTVNFGQEIPWEIFSEIVKYLVLPLVKTQTTPVGETKKNTYVNTIKFSLFDPVVINSELVPVFRDLTNLSSVNQSMRSILSDCKSLFVQNLFKQIFLDCDSYDVISRVITQIKEAEEDNKIKVMPSLRSFLAIAAQTSSKTEQWKEVLKDNPQEALKTLDDYQRLYLLKDVFEINALRTTIENVNVWHEIFLQGIAQKKISPRSTIYENRCTFPLLKFALDCAVQVGKFGFLEQLLAEGADIHEKYYVARGSEHSLTPVTTPLGYARAIENDEVCEKVLALFEKYSQ